MPTKPSPSLPGKKPSARDLAGLASSWIPEQLAGQALIRRVSSEEAREIIGGTRKGDLAGLLFPYLWPGEDHVREFRLRRDTPEIEYKEGRRKDVNKYLSPPGRGNMLYLVPGTAPEWLTRAKLPAVITEGEKKTLALWRLAHEAAGENAMLPKFLPIGLSGVWNWRGTIGKETGPNGERQDVKGPIADMSRLTWMDRKVTIAFDANVRGNDSVRAARRELAKWLIEQGARVYLAELPEEPGVNGVDDYLAKHGAGQALKVLRAAKAAKLEPKPAPEAKPDEQAEPYLDAAGAYRLTEKGLRYVRTNKDGSLSRLAITNFPAVITADVVKDDGESSTRALKIHATLHGHARDVIVTATEFAAMNWPIEQLGSRAIVYPNFKDHVRTAMQELSREIKEQYVYQHTGWTTIGGEPVYLHAGGGIGRNGPVPNLAVELERELRRFTLPEPPRGRELVRAIRASLGVLDVAPDRVTLPIYCAIWRAVLGIVDTSIHLSGQTGSGKSQIAALAQQHFGAGLDAKHLPASWDSTANALQAICFYTKNALVVVDDFVPKGSASDVARIHREADRLLRAQGNHAGRQRMSADAKIRPPKTPRGLILSTGEDVPKGNSLRARLVVVEMDPSDMNWNRLTECQRNAAAGLYTQAMAGFIQWVAPRMDKIGQRILEHLSWFREEWGDAGHHKRTPDNLANLSCGLEVFLDFAKEAGALNEKQTAEIWDRAMTAFKEAAEAQDKAQSHAEPTQQFLELVAAALMGGKCHLVAIDGAEPDKPAAAGWAKVNGDWRPQGLKIGWIDSTMVYLDPKLSYAAAQSLAKDISDPLPISQQTLAMRLKQRNLLAKCDTARRKTTYRLNVEGRRIDTLHILKRVLYRGEKADQADQD